MARRRPQSRIGERLRGARVRASLSIRELARKTDISPASLSRFESEKARIGFDEICRISAVLGVPLLYFATGRERTGDDPRDLIAHLACWGVTDVGGRERGLVGETKPLEELIPLAIGRAWRPRLLESVPGLLLKHKINEPEIIVQSARAKVIHRLGWLAEIAEWIAVQLPVSQIHPDALSSVRVIRETAWSSKLRPIEEWDLMGESHEVLEQRHKSIPPVTKRWRILYDTRQEEFGKRALELLDDR